MIGLVKALKNYKKNNTTKFSTYAYIWIKGEILEYIRCDRNIKISKELLSLSKEITIASEILRNKFNREPSISEIAFFLEKDIYLMSWRSCRRIIKILISFYRRNVSLGPNGL